MYFYASHNRHVENPDDKVIPSLSQLAEGVTSAFLKPVMGRPNLRVKTDVMVRRIVLEKSAARTVNPVA